MRPKYTFRELRRDCDRKPLPEDVNTRADDFAHKVLSGNPDVLKTLKLWREKKLFGNIRHYTEAVMFGKKTAIEAATFEVHWGIVRLIHSRQVVGESTIEERTIQNDSVTFANKPTAEPSAHTPTEEKHA
jgi:hypothetical protein